MIQVHNARLTFVTSNNLAKVRRSRINLTGNTARPGFFNRSQFPTAFTVIVKQVINVLLLGEIVQTCSGGVVTQILVILVFTRTIGCSASNVAERTTARVGEEHGRWIIAAHTTVTSSHVASFRVHRVDLIHKLAAASSDSESILLLLPVRIVAVGSGEEIGESWIDTVHESCALRRVAPERISRVVASEGRSFCAQLRIVSCTSGTGYVIGISHVRMILVPVSAGELVEIRRNLIAALRVSLESRIPVVAVAVAVVIVETGLGGVAGYVRNRDEILASGGGSVTTRETSVVGTG